MYLVGVFFQFLLLLPGTVQRPSETVVIDKFRLVVKFGFGGFQRNREKVGEGIVPNLKKQKYVPAV